MYQDYYDQDFQRQASQTKSPKGKKKKDKQEQDQNVGDRSKTISLPPVKGKEEYSELQGEVLNKTKKKDKQSKLNRRGESVDNLMQFQTSQSRSKAQQYKKATDKNEGSSNHSRNHSKSTFTLNNQKIKSNLLIRQGNIRVLGKNYERLALRNTLTTEVQKIEKYFNQSPEDLRTMKDDEINRLNNKVRQWIKRINADIDKKISEAIREKQTVSIKKIKSSEEVISLLSSQIINNEDALRLIQKEQEKLLTKQRQLEGEDYDMDMEDKKNKLKHAISNEKKNILNVRQNSVRLSEKLRTQQNPSTFSKEIESLKQKIVIEKNQYSKNNDIISKLDNHLSQLQNRLKHQNQTHEKMIEQAKIQCISLSQNPHLQEQIDELRQKILKLKGYNSNVQNIAHRTAQQIQHQLKLIRQQIKQYERDYSTTEELIEKNTEKALNLIQVNESHLLSRSPSSNAVNYFTQQKIQNTSSIFVPTIPLGKQEVKKKNIIQTEKISLSRKPQLVSIKENQEEKVLSKNPSVDVTHGEQAENEFMDINSSVLPNRIWIDKQRQNSLHPNQKQEVKNNNIETVAVDKKQEQQGPRIFPKRFKRRVQPKLENEVI